MLEVVKIGGSLLDRADLPDRLKRWCGQRKPTRQVFVVGGGVLVDFVRRWDARNPLDDETAHWTSITLMQVNTRLLAAAAGIPIARHGIALDAQLDSGGPSLLDVEQFMRSVEPQLPGIRLPASWEVTSDAIAARVAIVLRAKRLVLLKSADVPHTDANQPDQLSRLAECGYVDRFLPGLAAELPPLELINFAASAR